MTTVPIKMKRSEAMERICEVMDAGPAEILIGGLVSLGMLEIEVEPTVVTSLSRGMQLILWPATSADFGGRPHYEVIQLDDGVIGGHRVLWSSKNPEGKA